MHDSIEQQIRIYIAEDQVNLAIKILREERLLGLLEATNIARKLRAEFVAIRNKWIQGL